MATRKIRKFKDFLHRKNLIPKYDELALFLTTLTILLLLFTDPILRKDIYVSLLKLNIVILFFLSIFIYGMYLSIYYIFTMKKMSRTVKKILLLFAILLNLFIGISAGFHELTYTKGIFIIFPIYNIISAYLLYVMFDRSIGIITESVISDVPIRRLDTIISSFLVFLIFLLSQYIFKNYWAITFSICLVYATSIDRFIKKLLSRRKKEAEILVQTQK